MLRALLIDDSQTFLVAFCELLSRFPEVHVVGACCDGDEGLRVAAELMPDIVFVDMVMPGTNGMEVATQLQRRQPLIRVVMVSLHDDAWSRSRAGARGVEQFVCKSDLFDALPAIVNAPPRQPRAEGVLP